MFHTRLQHTLKVAQVGRRLAQICKKNQPELCASLGVHEEVVEAACLAHDLGHPPFGHIAETVLNELVLKTDPDGFEGNAQSFRILSKLAVRYACPGLDLTRATLAACLNIPGLESQALKVATKSGALIGLIVTIFSSPANYSREAQRARKPSLWTGRTTSHTRFTTSRTSIAAGLSPGIASSLATEVRGNVLQPEHPRQREEFVCR